MNRPPLVIRNDHKNMDHGFSSPFLIEYLTLPEDVHLDEMCFEIELDLPLLERPEETRHENVGIYYKIATRPGSTQWMVLVNGFSSSTKLWDYQVPYFLRHGYNLVLFDLLGQGNSWKPAGVEYTIAAQVRILERLVELTPLLENQFVLTGVSAGGMIAQTYALNHQEQLRALCLLATAPKVDGRMAFTQEIQRIYLSHPNLNDHDKLSFCAYFLMDHIFSDMYFRKFKPNIYGAIENNINNNSVGTYLGALCSVDNFDLLEQLPGLKIPTLIFTGLHDKIIETHNGVKLNQLIPNSRRYVLKGVHASHTFIIELFETFNEVLINELDRLDQFDPSRQPVHIENSHFQEYPTDDGISFDF